jgi:protein TonB
MIRFVPSFLHTVLASSAFVVLALPSAAQDEQAGPDTTEALVFVEVKPEFPGGQAGLFKYLSKEIRYPMDAREQGIEGSVHVAFVVDRDGSIADVQIMRGVFPSIDAEVVRVVSRMPAWTPGTQQGKPVKVRYAMPIKFALPDGRRKKAKG